MDTFFDRLEVPILINLTVDAFSKHYSPYNDVCLCVIFVSNRYAKDVYNVKLCSFILSIANEIVAKRKKRVKF